MTEKEIIDAIKYMQKYQTETDKLEAKTAEKGCPQKMLWYNFCIC